MPVASLLAVVSNYKNSPSKQVTSKKSKSKGKRRYAGGCGTILSSYNDDDYCCLCQRKMAWSGETKIRVKIERGER